MDAATQLRGIVALYKDYVDKRQHVAMSYMALLAPQQAAALAACSSGATDLLAAVPEASGTPIGHALAAASQTRGLATTNAPTGAPAPEKSG